MKLEKWMKWKHLRQEDAARYFNEYIKQNNLDFSLIGSSHIFYWRTGKKIPNRSSMELIKKVTEGRVKARDFLD